MQPRYLISASLLHAALILGLSLGLGTWFAADRPTPPRLLLRPSEAVLAQPPREAAAHEPLEKAEPSPDPELQDPPEVLPEPEPAERPAELVIRPEPPIPPLDELRHEAPLLARIRKPERVLEVVEAVAQPAEAQAEVRAEALEAENRVPVYPPLARRMGLEGESLVEVTVAVDGTVRRAVLLRSAGPRRGHKQMDQAALAALRSWRYQPAQRGGVAVEAVLRVPVEFRIHAVPTR